jgi:DNA-binding transcriptional regulator YiaG
MNSRNGRDEHSRHRASATVAINDIAGFLIHEGHDAIIATLSQEKNCDNRLCDNRRIAVQSGMTRNEIIAWMNAHGMKHKELARALGISPDKVSKSLAEGRKARKWSAEEIIKLQKLMHKYSYDEIDDSENLVAMWSRTPSEYRPIILKIWESIIKDLDES